MDHLLTYKTNAFSDRFSIAEQGKILGSLFKASWLEGSYDVNYKGEKYRFRQLGFFQPTIIVKDRNNNKEIARAQVNKSFFSYHPKATITLADGKEFDWKMTGFFHLQWEWTKDGSPFITAQENNGAFYTSGEINTIIGNQENNLMEMLGLYLRSSFAGSNLGGIILGLIVIIYMIVSTSG